MNESGAVTSVWPVGNYVTLYGAMSRRDVVLRETEKAPWGPVCLLELVGTDRQRGKRKEEDKLDPLFRSSSLSYSLSPSFSANTRMNHIENLCRAVPNRFPIINPV